MNSGTLDPTYQDPNPDFFFHPCLQCQSLCWGLAEPMDQCLLGRSHVVYLPVQSHTAPGTLPYCQYQLFFFFCEQDDPSSSLGWGHDLPTVTLAAEHS